MKKVLFLIPLFLFSLMVNATTWSISTSTPDALRTTLASAADGDEIIMAAGTYVESASNYIAFTGKHVTVKAATGAEVIIQPKVPITISEGGCAHFVGVKIDASHLLDTNDWYEHVIYPTDANTSNSMILDGCEFYGFSLNKSLLFCSSSNRLASVTITNCYFHNIMKSCLFIESTAGTNVSISNSTFANIETNTSSYDAGVIDTRATSGTFSVDHCTFYNVQAKNTDYAAIGKIKTPGAVVSNCIFSMPTSTADLRAIRDVSKANNCLTYNYTKDSNWGIHSDVTKNNCIQGQDPLFTDAANNDFQLATTSPAAMASDNWTSLGAKKWWPALTYPSTDFSSPYTLAGSAAKLVGNIRLNASNHIEYYDNSVCGNAAWRIHASRACAISATVNMETGSASGHILKMIIFDKDGNRIDSITSSYKNDDEDFVIPGCMYIPAVGDYVVALYNTQSHSSAKIEDITLSYAGGAVQNVSPSANTALPTADAWFTNSCTRDASGITYSSDNANAWIKWNIATSETAFYDVTVNVNTTLAHEFAVNIYEDESADPVASVAENGYTSSTGSPLALALGRINLAGGKNYVVKVTNVTSGSKAQVIDVTFAPVVTTVITIPETLLPGDAILSDRAWVDNDSLLFTARGDEGYNSSQWAKWQIMSEEKAKYKFTLHAFNAAPEGQGQKFAITILSEDESSQIATITSDWMDVGARTVVLSNVGLPAGNYIVKVEEPLWGATGRVLSIEVEREAITIDEAATSSTTNLGEYDTYTVNAHIVRTLVGGMYNTICLPFAVSAAEKARVFGSAKVKELTDSSIESDGFVLNLNFTEVNEMAAGVPYLIKPAANIENPTFLGVTIANTLNNSETDVADFIGNFVVSEVPEGRNNYFLSADNKLYYSNSATAINGMRGYFALKNISGNAPTRARIVEAENVVTEIDIVNGEMPETFTNTGKLIENGQLILVRDGIRYNALGVKIK